PESEALLITSSGTNTLKPQAALKPIPRQILNSVSIALLSFVRAHQLALREDMLSHRLLHVFLGRTGLQVQRRVERIQLEEIAMRFSRWRTRTAIAKLSEVVEALFGARRDELAFRKVFRQLARAGGQIIQHP